MFTLISPPQHEEQLQIDALTDVHSETIETLLHEERHYPPSPEFIAQANISDPQGTVTAGNSSSINDAAAAVVLMECEAAEKRGPGPVPAVRKVLERTGLCIKDMDVIELNEAFAAQALGVILELDLPRDRTNPNGSGLSLGHPVGASGCILTIKALSL